MSQKRVATRSSSRLKTQELGEERGGEDEGSQNQGQGQGPLDAVLAPTTKDDFMATDDFMRLLRGYVDVAELFHIFRLVSKPWQRIAEEKIDQDFRRGVLAFHGGNDMGVGGDEEFWDSLRAKREPVTRVIFLLNITKVGRSACAWAVNLVVVDIPEGVESISYGAFCQCHRLTTVSFPTTLTLIGESAFAACSSLENVDLLHTNLQEFGDAAFWSCSELKSMTIPDSLQTLGKGVFLECSKLVPSSIHVSYDSDGDVIDTTSDDVAHLRSQQRFAELEKMLAECDAENAALTTEVVTLTTEIAALTTKVAALKIANAPAHTNDFTSTIDFKRHFVGFVHIEMLLVLREVCKEWNEVVKDVVDESVESGAMIVHGGEDLQWSAAREERRKLVTQVVFLLNIIKVGERACKWAANLVVVDIPEGIESISNLAFELCKSLTTVSFPKTLTSIGKHAFGSCSSLDNIDLLHTNLQELGTYAFCLCRELKSMTIPDSLQKLDEYVFNGCSKLVPSSIDVSGGQNNDATSEVVTHLRSQQQNASS